MSKSLNNAIGIAEQPGEMYGKLMSISDDMMWRYYELLTDVSAQEIEQMRSQVASGELHPMKAKKALAERIVADFHSAEAARQAAENWEKQFQRDELPENVEAVALRYTEIGSEAADNGHSARMDKLLAKCGLVASASEGQRKIKERAVRVDGNVVAQPSFVIPRLPFEATIQVGRKIRRVTITL
jgi:tyrosyl-tRNA synthetase